MDNFERELLRPGDIVVYENGRHESNGSLAVVRRTRKIGRIQGVDVEWVTATGWVATVNPNGYGQLCFRKIGSLSDGSAV